MAERRFGDWPLALKSILGFWLAYALTVVIRATLGDDPLTTLQNKLLNILIGILLIMAGRILWRFSRVLPPKSADQDRVAGESLKYDEKGTLLVAGAGLFARSLYNLKSLDTGFNVDNLCLAVGMGLVLGLSPEVVARATEQLRDVQHVTRP